MLKLNYCLVPEVIFTVKPGDEILVPCVEVYPAFGAGSGLWAVLSLPDGTGPKRVKLLVRQQNMAVRAKRWHLRVIVDDVLGDIVTVRTNTGQEIVDSFTDDWLGKLKAAMVVYGGG